MIGLSTDAENMGPLITINDEPYSSIHSHTTVSGLDSIEPTDGDDRNNNASETISVNSASDLYYQHSDHINGNVFCVTDNRVNLEEVPLDALRQKSRDLLSKRLNDIKVILSENGTPRDWRGILSSIGLSDVINFVQSKPNPMKEVLTLWGDDCKIQPTIGNLQQILGNIDRWDVIDDTNDFFVEDSNNYWDVLSKSKESKVVSNPSKPSPQQHIEIHPLSDESNLLTRDDIALRKKNLPPQHYDAYLLFDEDDINFATQILEKMEEYGLKMCLKERDLIGGTIESDAVMRMISERCNRLVVIFSKAFLDSDSNSFLVKFALSIAIEKRMRKIIPIIYEECDLPHSMSMYYKLWYRNESSPYHAHFWTKLYESIERVPDETSYPAKVPEIRITATDSPSPVPSIELSPQHSSIHDFETPNTLSQKRKDKSRLKSISPKSSSPTTPTSLKKFCLPKLSSQSKLSKSMLTLDTTDQVDDKENGRCHSSLSLSNASTSPTPTNSKRKTKWLKKLFSPASAQKLSVESVSSGSGEKTKKKTFFHKRLQRRSKSREPVPDC